MVTPGGRPVEKILQDWRALERKLDTASETERSGLEEQIAAIREEHRLALAARQATLEALRRPPA